MPSEREKMLAGELYLASDPELVAERSQARRLLHRLNGLEPTAVAERRRLLIQLFGAFGPDSYIEPPFYCDYGKQIRTGARFYANFNCVILDCASVEIGDDVQFGPGVQIITATHPLKAEERIKGPEFAKPIRIGSRVWLGAGVLVMPGVTIGDDTTIGAGSVVTKDVPAGVLAFGNPCRVVRKV